MATILVADDDPRLLDAIEALLALEGHQVLRAKDGEEALRCAQSEHPALVITDYMMPRMDGGQLIEAFAGDPGLATVPVVLITALPSLPATLRVAGYVRKPFAPAHMIELVRRLTSQGQT
ncbi:Response regulator receiver protein [Paraburkholderia tropica]|uniref:response regulator transcription factor n=1 Tax=Paraburkholderia tropica TaxID=92647 RepID=UPI001CACD731|nr:response regulator [Paraburkholderia tropica]CAG9208917.1 Response regulator receiver protein [Paraburkholderia tropica]